MIISNPETFKTDEREMVGIIRVPECIIHYLVAQQIHILASPEGISISNQIPEGECRL
jgi:hypothetical protein